MATRSPGPRCRCEARRTGTAASIPHGFDCSGFVRYVYEQHGVAMPREVREQFRVGKTVDRDRLEPGDLVFFSTVAPGASHVGIVIGGDQFVHAPSERGVVRVENLGAQYWSTRYIGAKRVELNLLLRLAGLFLRVASAAEDVRQAVVPFVAGVLVQADPRSRASESPRSTAGSTCSDRQP